MKCDLCQNKASVFYTQVVDGEMTKSSWCESCAKTQGVSDPTGLHMLDLLAEEHEGEDEGETFSTTKKCGKCGFGLDDLQKIGRLGCPACYRTFRKVLGERIEGMHRGGSHVGRVPQGMALVNLDRAHVADLEEELTKAVREEDFEEAARLRDEIKQARDGMKDAGK